MIPPVSRYRLLRKAPNGALLAHGEDGCVPYERHGSVKVMEFESLTGYNSRPTSLIAVGWAGNGVPVAFMRDVECT